MKLRIAQIRGEDEDKDKFVIQYRTWYGTWRMAAFITDNEWNDFHQALNQARDYLEGRRRKNKVILSTWGV